MNRWTELLVDTVLLSGLLYAYGKHVEKKTVREIENGLLKEEANELRRKLGLPLKYS